MSPFLEIVLTNVVLASVLALPAWLVSRWGRRPALAHGLWLLVLLKLVTPPLWKLPIAWTADDASAAEVVVAEWSPQAVRAPDFEVAVAPEPIPAVRALEPMAVEQPLPEEIEPAAPEARLTPAVPVVTIDWMSWAAALWLLGSALWLGITLVRVRRFRRWLRFATPASPDLQARADALAQELAVRPVPVRLVPGPLSPMLWAPGGGAQLFVPRELLARLSDDAMETLLAHELAHWRRRDHWVRWLELVVLGLYWWCPLAWWARRELQQAEEECCDAWVVALRPGAARAYALALIETVDFLSQAPVAVPASASGIGQVRLLQRRLTMILRGKTPRRLNALGLLGLAMIGALLLPLMPTWAQQPEQPREKARGVEIPLELDLVDALTKGKDGLPLRFRIQVAAGDGVQQQIDDVTKAIRKQEAEAEQRLQALREQLAKLRRQQEQRRAEQADAKKPAGPAIEMRGGRIEFTPAARPDMERRLTEVERKLDMLIRELRDMRQDIQPGKRGALPGIPGAPEAGRGEARGIILQLVPAQKADRPQNPAGNSEQRPDDGRRERRADPAPDAPAAPRTPSIRDNGSR